MKTININVPLELRQTVLYPTAIGFTSRVETKYGQVDVTIFGLQKDVDAFLALNEHKTWLDDGPALPSVGVLRLQEWEKSAKQRGWSSPADLRGHTHFDEVELQEWRSAAKSFDVGSPKELVSITSLSFGELLERKIGRAWRDETGQETPELAGKRIASLVNDVHSLTQRVGALLDERTSWREKTNCDHPSEFDGEMIHLRESRNEMDREIRAWKKATGATDTHAAYAKIARLENMIFAYASEIDALRKAARLSKSAEVEVELDHGTLLTADGKTIGVVHNLERELAKMKAELDSKRRECQTEKERANENDRTMRARVVLLDKIVAALGMSSIVNYDELHVHVADLKRAYDKLDPGPITPEDRAKEAKAIGEMLSSHLRDSGIGSAAEALAARYAYLSSSWTKTMQVREILGAKLGESVVDATNRFVDHSHNLDQKSLDNLSVVIGVHDNSDPAKNANSIIDRAVSIIAEDTRKIADLEKQLKSAIVPLPKPQRADAGQRWAKIHLITKRTEDGDVYTNGVASSPIARATAMTHGDGSWVYLGK